MAWGCEKKEFLPRKTDYSLSKMPGDAIKVHQKCTRHLRLKVMRALEVDACTIRQVRTWLHVKVSYKNILYRTETVKDMGKSPIWAATSEDATWFPFDFTEEDDFVTLELFNRNNDSIGIAKLEFRSVSGLSPESIPEERILPVMVPMLVGKKEKRSGQLVVLTQMKRNEASGERGDLKLTLREGYIKGITSWSSKLSGIQAKLTYRHITFTSGELQKHGDLFMWIEGSEGTFNFLIDKTDPNDKINIQVLNHHTIAGECDTWVESLIKVEEVTLPLLLKGKPVGRIGVKSSLKLAEITRPANDSGGEEFVASDNHKEELRQHQELIFKLERHKEWMKKAPRIANFIALRRQQTCQASGWSNSLEPESNHLITKTHT